MVGHVQVLFGKGAVADRNNLLCYIIQWHTHKRKRTTNQSQQRHLVHFWWVICSEIPYPWLCLLSSEIILEWLFQPSVSWCTLHLALVLPPFYSQSPGASFAGLLCSCQLIKPPFTFSLLVYSLPGSCAYCTKDSNMSIDGSLCGCFRVVPTYKLTYNHTATRLNYRKRERIRLYDR